MPTPTPKCSQQIQAFAEAKKLTQKDLMGTAQISRTAANHYFHGENEPRYSVLQSWGINFGLNMNWLFYGDGPMFRAPSKFGDQSVEDNALRSQTAHLRLVHNGFAEEAAKTAPFRETKEVIIRGQDKEAFEAQIRLIDHVVQALAKTGASQEMIQRAILALVSGAF